MAWKGDESDVVPMSSADIKWAQWLRVARNFQLRVGLKDRRKETFDGFMREVSSHWLSSVHSCSLTVFYEGS
jgi:structure-specific recognition protein 1